MQENIHFNEEGSSLSSLSLLSLFRKRRQDFYVKPDRPVSRALCLLCAIR